jgi:agmatine/peptidylarginine deiminase
MFRKIGMSFLSLMFIGGMASASTANKINLSKRLSKAQKQEIINHNLNVIPLDTLSSSSPSGLVVQRPVAEYEDTGYILFHDSLEFGSADVKAKFVENLPAGVTAVIYSDSDNQKELEGLYRYYSQLAPSPDQVKIINIPNPSKEVMMPNRFGKEELVEVSPTGFWTRDAVPVPVIQLANKSPIKALSEVFTVVDAKYYHYYEPDQFMADFFSAEILSHNYYYEGGNFMVNAKGDCLVINTDETQLIPNSIFSKTYGCSNLVRLPYLKGIGHADESVKFVSDDHVITDDVRYKKILEAKGFKVTMLPRPKRDYETYVNSLIVNGTVWVPTFHQPNDKVAIDVYKNLGLNVVAADSSFLSNDGAGSLHCITMTYPKTTEFNELLKYFGAKDVVTSATVDAQVEKVVSELKQERVDSLKRLKDPGVDAYLDSLYSGWN